MAEIVPIRLRASFAYLIKGDRPTDKALLVDTGSPGELPALLAALKAAGVAPQDVALMLHTHAHFDHCGNTHALRETYGIPAAVQADDRAPFEAGRNVPIPRNSLFLRLLAPVLPDRYPGLAPDMVIESTLDLEPYGVRGCALHTPGHTPGSCSILVEGAGAIIGDLMAGGRLFGAVQPLHPNYHPIVLDRAQLLNSLRQILAYHPPKLYLGHGGPLDGAAVEQWLARQSAA